MTTTAPSREEEEYDSDCEIDLEEEANLSQWLLQNNASRCSISLNFSTEENEESESGRLSLGLEASAMINGVFYMEHNIERLTDALELNTQTKIVEILLDGDWSTLNLTPSASSSFTGLISILCEKSSLEGLVVEGGSGSVTILNYILLHAQNLEIIEFYDLLLYGAETAFEKLSRNLRIHPKLKQVNSFYLQIVAQNASQKMDQLLQAILQAPALKSLGVWTHSKPERELFSTSTLVQACSSPTLTNLQLNGVLTHANIQDEAVAQMAKALTENQVLRSLQLGVDLNPQNTPALSQLLRQNQVLESIRIDLTQNPRELRRHQSCMIHLAQALQDNPTLTKFKLVGDMHAVQLDDAVIQAFEALLETNYTLQELMLLDYNECDQRAKLDFYLILNQMDRKEILGLAEHHTEEWLDRIAKLDVDATLYYLSRNPSIFSNFASTT